MKFDQFNFLIDFTCRQTVKSSTVKVRKVIKVCKVFFLVVDLSLVCRRRLDDGLRRLGQNVRPAHHTADNGLAQHAGGVHPRLQGGACKVR